jgi:lysophospholipase L1-like esterase
MDVPPPLTPATRDARRAARRRAVRRRRLTALGAATIGGALLAAGVALARSSGERPSRETAVAAPRAERPSCTPTRVELPSWYTGKRATILVDSVLLGGVPAVRANLAGWKVTQVGRPAVMVRLLEDELARAGTRIAPLAIVGVGYNSLWERGRSNYARWAGEFDRHARDLLRTLRRQGAEQIVWVTLRDARRGVIPGNSLWQYDKYAWYFPYVNERLQRLDRRRGDLVLADWAKVSNRPAVTYDAIHLNPEGQALMARTVRRAIEQEAARQLRAARRDARRACAAAGG